MNLQKGSNVEIENTTQENPIGQPKPPLGTAASANDDTSYNYIASREDAYLEEEDK